MHDLAGVILIRRRIGAVHNRIPSHVKVFAHSRIESYFIEQGAEITECVAVNRLKVRSKPTRFVVIQVAAADDDQLVQSKRYALSQLIRLRQSIREELLLQRVQRVVIAHANRVAGTRLINGIEWSQWIIRLHVAEQWRRVELFV